MRRRQAIQGGARVCPDPPREGVVAEPNRHLRSDRLSRWALRAFFAAALPVSEARKNPARAVVEEAFLEEATLVHGMEAYQHPRAVHITHFKEFQLSSSAGVIGSVEGSVLCGNGRGDATAAGGKPFVAERDLDHGVQEARSEDAVAIQKAHQIMPSRGRRREDC
jgi:hypothetical protein